MVVALSPLALVRYSERLPQQQQQWPQGQAQAQGGALSVNAALQMIDSVFDSNVASSLTRTRAVP